jgi:hypothetical protein
LNDRDPPVAHRRRLLDREGRSQVTYETSRVPSYALSAGAAANERPSISRELAALHESTEHALAATRLEVEESSGLRQRELEAGHLSELRANPDMELEVVVTV